MNLMAMAVYAQPPVRGSPVTAATVPELGEAWLGRGALVSVTPLGRWDVTEVRQYLQDFELDASQVKFGVDGYRVVYRTLDAFGAPTIASSLLAAPRGSEAWALSQVVWLHGTSVYKADAASMNEDSDDRATAFAFAAAGFVTTAPDYLGLGAGPGTHPYEDRPSEVTASIDALRATRTLAYWFDWRLSPRVAISGFSQGGGSSMALARALQNGADAHLRPGALAPIAGPYDMSRSLAAALSGEIELAPAYLAYLTVAWNRLHHLYDAPSEAFLPPYDQSIEALFDNTHSAEEVLTSLPETLGELFTPRFLDALAHPSGSLRAALEVADAVCDFQPAVATHLFAASGDRDVPIANALACQRKLESHGATVALTDFGEEIDHSANLAPALTRVIALFRGVEADH